MLAKGADLKAGQLIGQLGDCHLYNNHFEQAKRYLNRPDIYSIPKLELSKGVTLEGSNVIIPEANEIKLNNYNPLPAIKAELSVGK
jgi:thymidylate synthase